VKSEKGAHPQRFMLSAPSSIREGKGLPMDSPADFLNGTSGRMFLRDFQDLCGSTERVAMRPEPCGPAWDTGLNSIPDTERTEVANSGRQSLVPIEAQRYLWRIWDGRLATDGRIGQGAIGVASWG
jgi:hypothetical protein